MKIEIDLSDILHDEHGDPAETLAGSIKRQVIEVLVNEVKKDTKRQISDRVRGAIDEALAGALKDQIPALVNDVVNKPYVPVDEYGRRGEKTTFRDQIIGTLQREMVYKTARYDTDKNAFTKAVDTLVGERLTAFKADFNKAVDAQFTAAAMEYAAQRLRERLGIKS